MSKPPGPDYDGKFRESMAKNADAVIAALDRGATWLMDKIAKAATRFGIAEQDIVSDLRTSKVLRYWLAKDPSKQQLHEKTAAEFIRQLPEVQDFAKGPSMVVCNGRVVSPAEASKMRRQDRSLVESKTIDFQWRTNGMRCYVSHKHTHEDGGAQDNQRKDVETFIREAAKNDTPNIFFIALCDGAYYQNNARLTNMQEIATSARHENVAAMETCYLQEFLRGISRS